MRNFAIAILITCLPLALPISANSQTTEVPQQDATPAKEESKPTSSDSPRDLDLEISMMSRIMKSIIDQIDMNDEQRATINVLIDEAVPKIIEAESTLKNTLTKEQHAQFKEAFLLGRRAAFTIPRAESYALGQLKLPREQRTKYLQAKQDVKYLRIKLHNEMASLLSREQREQLPMFDRPKLRRFDLQLPNASSEQQLKEVEAALKKIPTLQIVGPLDHALSGTNGFRLQIRKSERQLKPFLDKLVENGMAAFSGYTLQNVKFTDNKDKSNSNQPDNDD